MSKKISKKPSRKIRKKNTNRLYHLSNFFLQAKTLIAIGIILILISGVYHVYEITKYSFTSSPIQEVKTQYKRLPKPVHITIENTDMNFSVAETVIQHGVWQIDNNGVSHLGISANPGEKGIIIMYGHNTLNRLGSLPFVSIGQHIFITTSDKKTHNYVIKKTQVVDPNDTKILTSQKGEVLLIYTCYGFADLQRFVVFAYPSTS